MSPSTRKETTVGDLMVTNVVSVTPMTTVGRALDLMFEKNILALPVVENDQCVGMVTATDLVRLLRETDKLLRSEYPHFDDCLWAVDLVQRKLDQDPIREIMSEVVLTTTADATADELAATMLQKSVHHIPVLDKEDKLIGFVTASDFVRGWLG